MGLAYLPDGSLIDYKEYIEKHPHWQAVRKARFNFDGGRCAICHKDLHGQVYHTHHLHYQRLGHERMRDVLTLCPACHKAFHESWHQATFFRGRESGHWEAYDMHHTAMVCSRIWRSDRFISRNAKDKNFCSKSNIRAAIAWHLRHTEGKDVVVIDPNDIALFVRNKRYGLYFEAETRGLTVEQFLDEYYGTKVRGKNPLRQEASRKGGPFALDAGNMHRKYNENKNILLLMEAVEKMEGK